MQTGKSGVRNMQTRYGKESKMNVKMLKYIYIYQKNNTNNNVRK